MTPTPEDRFPRRAAGKARTRQRIENAARQLFSELGYADATMAAIAEAADVHITTLFTHFPGKRDLMDAVAAAAGAFFEKAVISHRAAGVTALDFWRDLVGRTANAYERDSDAQIKLGRAMAGEPELLPAWIAHQRRQVDLMTTYIADEMQVDPAIDRRPQMAAAMLVAGGLMAFEAWLGSGRTGDLVAENALLLDAAESILASGLPLSRTKAPGSA